MLSERVPYFILDLLQQTPAVDIAGLGRFEAIFHPATIDTATAKIKPPYLRPDFQELNKEDHHLLASYMVYVTGEERNVVEEAIREFVARVNMEAHNGHSCAISDFGTFYRSDSESLRFTPDWEAFNLSFKGLESIDLHMHEQVHTPPVYSPPVITPMEEVEDQYEIIPRKIKETTAVDKADATSFAAVTDPDDTTNRLWWMILISALVLITVLCVYLAWDIISNRHKLNELRQVYSDSIPTVPADMTPVKADTTKAVTPPTPIETPAPAKPPVITPPRGGEFCYVVVGAFGQPSNVTRMVERLKGMGYTAEQLAGPKLTKVAIKTSCEKETLQRVLGEARASVNPEAWIL